MIELIPFFLLMLYLVPFCVAAGRDHPSSIVILVLNLALGWTGVGWMAALTWAALTPTDDWARPLRGARPQTNGCTISSAKRSSRAWSPPWITT